MEDGFEGDPQLLCEHKHDGDVLDLQVSVMWTTSGPNLTPCSIMDIMLNIIFKISAVYCDLKRTISCIRFGLGERNKETI